jgi:ubiquinone/menaquinone biosynthesis C-methylase UbiE
MTLEEIIEASKRLDNITDPSDVLKELSRVVADSGKEKEKEKTE